YRFSFHAGANRFHVHSQSSGRLDEKWTNPEPGWKPRASSPTVAVNTAYRVRAEIRRTTWRVTVREHDQRPLQPPFWDTGAVPMDDLAQTRLLFADVEPDKGTGASRWGPITICQQRR